MTRPPVKAEVMPEDLRDEMPVDDRGRVDRPPRELRGEVFRRFLAALEPLRSTGKLGGILFQLPQYVVCKPSSLDYLEWAAAQLGADRMLVEFRHRSWFEEGAVAETLRWLEERGLVTGLRYRGRLARLFSLRAATVARIRLPMIVAAASTRLLGTGRLFVGLRGFVNRLWRPGNAGRLFVGLCGFRRWLVRRLRAKARPQHIGGKAGGLLAACRIVLA